MKDQVFYRHIAAAFATVCLSALLSVSAFAAKWDISKGDITVDSTFGMRTVHQNGASMVDESPVIYGSTSAYTLTIIGDDELTANVSLGDTATGAGLTIDLGDTQKAAVQVSGNACIELDGVVMVRSGANRAGIEKQDASQLTIQDIDNNGTLVAAGGTEAAGIGCPNTGECNNISITGGKVDATGGRSGAGIGGGSCSGVSVSGNAVVTAQGGACTRGVFRIKIGPGAAIGCGGCDVDCTAHTHPSDCSGTSIIPDTTGLTTGSVTCKDADGNILSTICAA